MTWAPLTITTALDGLVINNEYNEILLFVNMGEERSFGPDYTDFFFGC